MDSRCRSIRTVLILVFLFFVYEASPGTAQSCGSTGLAVQVLGSGGPEVQDKRASTSYLIWERSADLFVAHNAVPEEATGVERRLHMPPSLE